MPLCADLAKQRNVAPFSVRMQERRNVAPFSLGMQERRNVAPFSVGMQEQRNVAPFSVGMQEQRNVASFSVYRYARTAECRSMLAKYSKGISMLVLLQLSLCGYYKNNFDFRVQIVKNEEKLFYTLGTV
jgi:hypothetical protein